MSVNSVNSDAVSIKKISHKDVLYTHHNPLSLYWYITHAEIMGYPYICWNDMIYYVGERFSFSNCLGKEEEIVE